MITHEEVRRIAKLAKFRFTEEEIANFANQLTNIMDMIDILNEIDCSSVEPLTSVCDMLQRLRKDEVTCGDISDDLFSNLPGDKMQFAREVKCFIVPKVVE